MSAQNSPSMCHDLKKLKDREKFSDVKIICGEMEFKCHKIILAARSEVFDTMFSHDDTKESLSGEIVITDVEPQVMEQMVNFIYADSCQANSWEEVVELLICADKYDLRGLKKACEEELSNQMDKLEPSMIVKLLKLSHLLKLSKMKDMAIHTIPWKFKQVC